MYNRGVFKTYQKGLLAELKVQLRATELGHLVSKPIVEARYDLVLDIAGKLFRVQVKYADNPPSGNVTGSFHLDLRKQTRNHGPKRAYSQEEVDLVLVYLPSLDRIVKLEPPLFHEKGSITLRVAPTKNGQSKNVTLVDDLLW